MLTVGWWVRLFGGNTVATIDNTIESDIVNIWLNIAVLLWCLASNLNRLSERNIVIMADCQALIGDSKVKCPMRGCVQHISVWAKNKNTGRIEERDVSLCYYHHKALLNDNVQPITKICGLVGVSDEEFENWKSQNQKKHESIFDGKGDLNQWGPNPQFTNSGLGVNSKSEDDSIDISQLERMMSTSVWWSLTRLKPRPKNSK